MELRDARDYQIFFLGSFLILGLVARDWTVNLAWVALLLAACLLTQLALAWQSHQAQMEPQLGRLQSWAESLATVLPSLKSALITGLGLCLLLRSNQLSILLLAGLLAIASKFLLRVNGKHIFNPANLGIIAALGLTGSAWVSPGQWGTAFWLVALFLGCGGLVLGKVGRWDTSAVFFAVYAGLSFGRNLWLGWAPEVVLHHLSSGSLLVFTLFMITDPRSIPNARSGRILWATAIAILTFILQYGFYLPTAPFWALFCCAPLTIALDRHWLAPRFTWQPRTLPLIP